MFGIRPTGFHSFAIAPNLPKAWGSMQLRNIHAFGSVFDLVIIRAGEKLRLETAVDRQPPTSRVVDVGTTIDINLGVPH